MKIELNIEITDENIDDIMVSALEGGITYWCSKAEVVGDYLGEYASDQISRDGTLKLYDKECGETYELTKDKFMDGVGMYIKQLDHFNVIEYASGKYVLNTGHIDGTAADSVIQFAVFGEVIYS